MDGIVRDGLKVGTDFWVLGDALPEDECVRVHFEPCGLVFWLGELWLEGALDYFASAAGAEAHGEHVIYGSERVGALLGEEEAEVAPVHIGVGDQLAKAVQANHALAVFDGNPLSCMELTRSLGPVAWVFKGTGV